MTHLAEKRTMMLAIGMTVLLFALILMRWQSARSAPPIQPVVPALSSLKSSSVLAPVITAEAGSVIQSRPVFWQTRAPYVAPPPRKPPPKPFRAVKLGVDSFDQVKLSGTYSVSGQTVLIVVGSEGSQRVRVGDDLAGWTFKSMAAGGAVFTQDGEQRTLVMQKPTPPTKAELEKQSAEIQARLERRALKAAASTTTAETDLEQLKADLEGLIAADAVLPADAAQRMPATGEPVATTPKAARDEGGGAISFESISQRWEERGAPAKPTQ